MIRPRGYQAAQYFTLNIVHPNRNQSTQSQSESYFNDSLNVSFVIQKKRTVIHNLFSFPDNSLSYKSRNLIAIHVIGRVDVSINKFFGSFLNLFWAFTLIFKEISYFALFQKKTNFAFFYVWFSLYVLTRVIGRGSNIVIFFSGRQNKTFKPSSKFFHNGRLINLSVDFFCKTSSLLVIQ